MKFNILINYLGRIIPALFSIIMIPIYIKYMGVESYGLVGFYTTLSSLLSVLDLGIGATINRELAIQNNQENNKVYQRNLVRTLELIYWTVSILSGLLLIGLAPIIANSMIASEGLPRESIITAVKLMGISFSFQFPISLYQGGLLGLQKYVLLNTLSIVFTIIRNVGILFLLVFISPSIQTFFLGQSIFSFLSSIAFMIALWRVLPKDNIRAKFKKSIILDNWKFAFAVSVSSIVGVILSQLDKVILASMLSLNMFAYYTVASSVSSAVWMCIIPLNTAIFPKLVQLYHNKCEGELILFFHKSSQFVSLIIFPICALLVIYSKSILALWIGDPIIVNNSNLIVSFLVLGVMLNGMVSLPVNCATAFGWPTLITYTNIIQAVFIIPLIITLVYFFQAFGAAVAWVIMNSTYIIFAVPRFFKRHLGNEKIDWYVKDILVPCIVSFVVTILSYFFYQAFLIDTNKFFYLVFIGFITLSLTSLSLPLIRQQLIALLKVKFYK